LRKLLAALVLIPLVFGILGFTPLDRLPGQVLVWVRPEEIVRGRGTPSIVFLVANTTGKPLVLNSIDTKKDGLLCASQTVQRSLPVLTAAESKILMDVLSGARLDFPKELASRTCIMSVPIPVKHDGLSEKVVNLSVDLAFDDGSSRTLESTALLTTSLPAEPGWVAGDGHIHSDFSDGGYSVYQRRNDAINFGYKWIFMTDHSGALSSTYVDYVYTCGHAANSSLAIGADQEVSAFEGGHYLAYRCNQPLGDGFYDESYIDVSYYIKGASPSTIIRWFRLIRVSDGSIVPNSGDVPNANLYQGTKSVIFVASDDAYYLEVELQDSSGVIQRVYTNPIFLDR